jgi:hypothetical protein
MSIGGARKRLSAKYYSLARTSISVQIKKLAEKFWRRNYEVQLLSPLADTTFENKKYNWNSLKINKFT